VVFNVRLTMASDEKEALDALEKEASEFTKDAEIDRIRKAFSLDAYAVLDLQPGVPESDIKIQYRKKSLLIHPDKTKNPAAPDAFDRLKKGTDSAARREGSDQFGRMHRGCAKTSYSPAQIYT